MDVYLEALPFKPVYESLEGLKLLHFNEVSLVKNLFIFSDDEQSHRCIKNSEATTPQIYERRWQEEIGEKKKDLKGNQMTFKGHGTCNSVKDLEKVTV